MIYQFALLFMAVGYFIVSQSTVYSSFLVGLFIAGMGTGLLMPTGNLWMMRIAPEKIRGTLVGRLSRASFLGMFLSPIIFQPIIKYFDVSTAFEVASITMIVIAAAASAIKSEM